MAMTDPLSDLLTRIRNGQQARLANVVTPASKMRARVLDVLAKEGYIRGYSTAELGQGIAEYTVELKYADGEPVIREIRRISRPGRRVYSKINDLRSVYGGLGVAILSTPKGVLADHEARAANVGGEVLCHVF